MHGVDRSPASREDVMATLEGMAYDCSGANAATQQIVSASSTATWQLAGPSNVAGADEYGQR